MSFVKWESIRNLMFNKIGGEKFDLSKDEMVKQRKTSNFMLKVYFFSSSLALLHKSLVIYQICTRLASL